MADQWEVTVVERPDGGAPLEPTHPDDPTPEVRIVCCVVEADSRDAAFDAGREHARILWRGKYGDDLPGGADIHVRAVGG